MRALIVRLLFGADEIVQYMTALLEARYAATKQHARNKRLKEELLQGQADAVEYIAQYNYARASLEAAYRLELN